MASLHVEALRVALELTARAILEAQGLPWIMCTLEAQVAALEPTLRGAPGAKEAMENRITLGATLR